MLLYGEPDASRARLDTLHARWPLRVRSDPVYAEAITARVFAEHDEAAADLIDSARTAKARRLRDGRTRTFGSGGAALRRWSARAVAPLPLHRSPHRREPHGAAQLPAIPLPRADGQPRALPC